MESKAFANFDSLNKRLAGLEGRKLSEYSLLEEPGWQQEWLYSLRFEQEYDWINWANFLLRQLPITDDNRPSRHGRE